MSCCCWPEPDPFPNAAVAVLAAARTDTGKCREGNEDCVAFADASTGRAWRPPASALVETDEGSFVALVCDGMGGEAGGEVASAAAVETILASLRAAYANRAPVDRLAQTLSASIEGASARIRRIATADPRLARMGTTATLVATTRAGLVCAHVGDSRAYRLRPARDDLTRLTRDQTMAELLRSSGVVPIDEAGEPYGSNVILQAVGASSRLEVAISRADLAAGDVVMVCSDGLHGVVPDDTIARVLATLPPPDACDALVDAANAAGGPDNVSCVVFRVR